MTLLIFAAASVGATLLIPSYFQLVLHQTPMQAGLNMVPVGLGALVALPIAGVYMDKYGSGKIVLIGLPVMAMGLGIFHVGCGPAGALFPGAARRADNHGFGRGLHHDAALGSAHAVARPAPIAGARRWSASISS